MDVCGWSGAGEFSGSDWLTLMEEAAADSGAAAHPAQSISASAAAIHRFISFFLRENRHAAPVRMDGRCPCLYRFSEQNHQLCW